VLWLVLALNWAVAAAKIIYGLIKPFVKYEGGWLPFIKRRTSNIIGIIGIYFCSRPKDETILTAIKKYETLFALGIAAMLFDGGF